MVELPSDLILLFCDSCGLTYCIERAEYNRRRRTFLPFGCSEACTKRARAAAAASALASRVLPFTWRPVSNCHKRKKIRANGLINMRIRRGLLKRQKACQECGRACRTDAHHDDYSRPEAVTFLCRSCHAKRHMATTPA
jgi:hypothetical protein